MRMLLLALACLFPSTTLASPIYTGAATLLGDDPADGVAVADVAFRPITWELIFDNHPEGEHVPVGGFLHFTITGWGLEPGGHYWVGFSGISHPMWGNLTMTADMDGNGYWQDRLGFDVGSSWQIALDAAWQPFGGQSVSLYLMHAPGYDHETDRTIRLAGTVEPHVPEPSSLTLLLGAGAVLLARRRTAPAGR